MLGTALSPTLSPTTTGEKLASTFQSQEPQAVAFQLQSVPRAGKVEARRAGGGLLVEPEVISVARSDQPRLFSSLLHPRRATGASRVTRFKEGLLIGTANVGLVEEGGAR